MVRPEEPGEPGSSDVFKGKSPRGFAPWGLMRILAAGVQASGRGTIMPSRMNSRAIVWLQRPRD